MKKILLICGLLGMWTSTCNAILNIAWGASAGFYIPATPAQGFMSPTDSVPVSNALVQLIFTVDANIDPVDISNALNGYVSGDDQVIDTYIVDNTAAGGSMWGYFSAGSVTQAYTAGFVYGRVFQDANIMVGQYYYNGLTNTVNDLPVVSSPDAYEFNTDLALGNGLDQTIVAIPEPGTMVLFGLGMVVLAGRKVLRKKK
ncbi:MAG: PEP-CTERM sorting domain-containing protein [Kiritimatiellae bacterium]|nr:PEP-CTERM sorting domain-containing protein [Kiritimatiellia bacterium]MDD5521075.1 PEP-CTERM sorting domain-containing protein [Kiritimatiellia bacterium]